MVRCAPVVTQGRIARQMGQGQSAAPAGEGQTVVVTEGSQIDLAEGDQKVHLLTDR